MPVYERISAVVSLTLIGLALYFVIEFPIQPANWTLLGSPLAINSPRQWLMMLLLAGLAMTGTDTVIRMHPNLSSLQLSYLATFWMLPGLCVILATQVLRLAPNPVVWAVGLVGVGVLLWAAIIAEFHQVSPGTTTHYISHLWRQFMGYSTALALFIIIYQTRSRSALSATGVLLVSSMIALALLRRTPALISKTWLFAVIIGLCLGQITWALNYWRVGPLNPGLLLLLIIYILIGLAQQQLLGRLSRQIVWEFGIIAIIALIVIFNLAP